MKKDSVRKVAMQFEQYKSYRDAISLFSGAMGLGTIWPASFMAEGAIILIEDVRI